MRRCMATSLQLLAVLLGELRLVRGFRRLEPRFGLAHRFLVALVDFGLLPIDLGLLPGLLGRALGACFVRGFLDFGLALRSRRILLRLLHRHLLVLLLLLFVLAAL